jgi:hypothetical protein
MQKDFEDSWDYSFGNMLDLTDIAQKLVNSHLLNKGNISCNEFVMKQDKVVVKGNVEKRGKFNNIQWLDFNIILNKHSEKSLELADGNLVEGTGETTFSYQLEFMEDDIDQHTEASVEAKLSQFFEKARSEQVERMEK